MTNLKPCPCGKTPERLHIVGFSAHGAGSKYEYATGSCCGDWHIEYRNNYATGDEALRLATEAWNAAPRGDHEN